MEVYLFSGRQAGPGVLIFLNQSANVKAGIRLYTALFLSFPLNYPVEELYG
jgi:hypothetical protein